MNRLVLVVILLLGVSEFSFSQIWEGDVDSDWNNPLNWSGNSLPSDGDLIVIDPTVFNYTNAPIMSTNSLFDPEDINIENGGTFSMTGGTLNIDNDLEIKTGGSFVISGGTFNIADDIDVEDGSTYTQTGGTVDVSDEMIIVGGSNNINISGGQFDIGNDVEVDSSNNTFNFSGNADINIFDDFDFDGTNGNTINLTGNANLQVDELVELGTTGTSNQFNLCDDAIATFSDGSDLADDNDALPNFDVKDNATLNLGALPPVLPVELLFFKASSQDQQIELNWTTATEVENDHFELFKSSNGSDFYSIGTVPGNGDSNERIDYQFIDVSPSRGMNFYQLKQVDFDGTSEYFEIISVYHGSELNDHNSMRIWPNPTSPNSTVNIQLSGHLRDSQVNVKIIDLNGREVVRNTSTDISIGEFENSRICPTRIVHSRNQHIDYQGSVTADSPIGQG